MCTACLSVANVVKQWTRVPACFKWLDVSLSAV